MFFYEPFISEIEMKTLDLYIGSGFTRYFLLVLFILAFLFSLFEFFGQLDDVGRGYYQLQDAFFFVLLTLPGRILDLIPGRRPAGQHYLPWSSV